uniref:Uncharacterized protein n=1 Tax=Arundo donax TaxID=35708 RepID=A0A0A8ZY71_ARUDO
MTEVVVFSSNVLKLFPCVDQCLEIPANRRSYVSTKYSPLIECSCCDL